MRKGLLAFLAFQLRGEQFVNDHLGTLCFGQFDGRPFVEKPCGDFSDPSAGLLGGAIMAADFCKALRRRSQDAYLQAYAEMLGGAASLAKNAGRFGVIEMVEDVVGAQIDQLAAEGVAVVELALREERLGFAEHDETVRMGQIQHKALKRRVFRHVVADD